MDKRRVGYLVAGISWGGIIAFVFVFVLGADLFGTNHMTLVLGLWASALFWPTIIAALFIRSAKGFFWLSLFLSPIGCVMFFV